MLSQILILLSASLGLISLLGLIRPSIVMQTDRKKVVLYFLAPAIILLLIGTSLVN